MNVTIALVGILGILAACASLLSRTSASSPAGGNTSVGCQLFALGHLDATYTRSSSASGVEIMASNSYPSWRVDWRIVFIRMGHWQLYYHDGAFMRQEISQWFETSRRRSVTGDYLQLWIGFYCALPVLVVSWEVSSWSLGRLSTKRAVACLVPDHLAVTSQIQTVSESASRSLTQWWSVNLKLLQAVLILARYLSSEQEPRWTLGNADFASCPLCATCSRTMPLRRDGNIRVQDCCQGFGRPPLRRSASLHSPSSTEIRPTHPQALASMFPKLRILRTIPRGSRESSARKFATILEVRVGIAFSFSLRAAWGHQWDEATGEAWRLRLTQLCRLKVTIRLPANVNPPPPPMAILWRPWQLQRSLLGSIANLTFWIMTQLGPKHPSQFGQWARDPECNPACPLCLFGFSCGFLPPYQPTPPTPLEGCPHPFTQWGLESLERTWCITSICYSFNVPKELGQPKSGCHLQEVAWVGCKWKVTCPLTCCRKEGVGSLIECAPTFSYRAANEWWHHSGCLGPLPGDSPVPAPRLPTLWNQGLQPGYSWAQLS